MTIDLKRSGYDNLFLVGGYDWHAKFTAVSPLDVDSKAKTLSANFDKLDKKDVMLVAKWENEVRHACGLKGKPLPVVAKIEMKEPVKTAPAPAPAIAAPVEAPAETKVETPKPE